MVGHSQHTQITNHSLGKPDPEAMAIIIPHDVLLHHILPRLPTKIVGRFMCASKELHEFLSSDVFKKLHFRHTGYQQNHEKFLVVLCNDDYSRVPSTLGTIDCEAPDNLIPRSFRLPKAKGISGVRYLTSFHGLVCLRIIPLRKNVLGYYMSERKKDSELILWNPLTSEHKMLSKPESHKEIHWESTFGLSYSSIEDDYKLVSVLSRNNVHIYSLKSDSWRKVAFQDTSELRRYQLSQGICLNENLYFLNYDDDKYSVIRFDTKTETITEMNTPLLNDVENSYHMTLMVQNGCIHVCLIYDVEKKHHEIQLIELWKINEEGNWKKMETYRVDQYNMGDMKPLHWTRNENLLMLGLTFKKHLDLYRNKGFIYNIDLKKNKMKKKKPWKGTGKGKQRLLPVANMRISEIVRYTETFVSPNQYTK